MSASSESESLDLSEVGELAVAAKQAFDEVRELFKSIRAARKLDSADGKKISTKEWQEISDEALDVGRAALTLAALARDAARD